MKKNKFLLNCLLCILALLGFSHSVSAQSQQNLNMSSELRIFLDNLSARENKKLQTYLFSHENLLYYFGSLFVEERNRLNINIDIIYTDSMRNRILSLLNNEYSEIELDTLVERAMKRTVKQQAQAMDLCQFDTLSIYKERLKTYYARLKEEKKNKGESVGYDYFYKYDVFELLGFDTTACYKKAYDSLCIEERKTLREMYQNHQYDKTDLIRAAGYIKDDRFIESLKRLYTRGSSSEQAEAYEALMRMRVEPYYTEYLKQYVYTSQEIKEGGYLKEYSRVTELFRQLTYIIQSQESLKELSKYLFAEQDDIFLTSVGILNAGKIYYTALNYLLIYIQNVDFQKKWEHYGIKNDKFRQELPAKKSLKIRQEMYDWMQKNYGKYEIARD